MRLSSSLSAMIPSMRRERASEMRASSAGSGSRSTRSPEV